MVSSTTSIEDLSSDQGIPLIYSDGAYRKLPVYEQSVSIIASLDENDSNENGKYHSVISSLGLSSDDLPIVIGVGGGVLFLLIIIFVVLICSCLKLRNKKDHNEYRINKLKATSPQEVKLENGVNQSDSMVMLTCGDKSKVPYESYLIEKPENMYLYSTDNDPQMKSNFSNQDMNLNDTIMIKRLPISNPMDDDYMFSTLPRPNQKVIQSCEFLNETGSGAFASCEDLEENFSRDRTRTIDQILSSDARSRSLPNWCKSKPRPLSTAGDSRELRDKVNFTKKRKNRMKNDCAAAIALTKSRTNILTHTDTDSLVDNEAEVVYDERTAL